MRRYLAALCAVIALLTGASSAQAWSNGNAPSSAMSPIASGVKCTPLQGQMANRAAAGWNTMALAAGEKLPTNGCDSAYRPYARQVYWRNYWCGLGSCGNAAVPGYSNHGLGLAADVPQYVRGYIDKHGKRFGWCKCWSDAPSEWWHIKFNGAAFGRPNPGPNLHSPVLRRRSGGPGQNVYVRKLQKLIRGHGDKSVEVDGEFGRSTEIAVRRFQRAEKIKVNGVVSRRVWKRLRQPIVKPLPKPLAPAQPVAPPKPKPLPSKPINGVDVSMHQGDINWEAVKRDGIEFAIVKASEGQDYRDPTFTRPRLRAIVKAGLVPGVYHFLRPRSDRTGAREAAWFIQVIGQAGYGKGFLPPVIDVEQTTLSAAGTCRYVGSFARLVRKEFGVKPIVYTYPSFAQSYLSGCSWLRNYRLWIAHYGVSTPTVPTPWSDYIAWQFTSTGSVDGIHGNVDVNVLPGGKRALAKLRLKGLTKLVRLAPRAKVELPLASESRVQLRAEVPAADVEPLPEVPAPEGDHVRLPIVH